MRLSDHPHHCAFLVERIVMAFEKGRRAKAKVEAREREQQNEETVTLSKQEWQQLLNRVETLAKRSEMTAATPQEITVSQVADATAKAVAAVTKTRPTENNPGPLVSDFNPRGERDHPRPRLRATMYFGSAPIGTPTDNSQLTEEEITALNAVTPGYYSIAKMDGSKAVVEVKGQVNANRTLERLWFILPEGDDDKNLYPPLTRFADQCSEEQRVDPVLV